MRLFAESLISAMPTVPFSNRSGRSAAELAACGHQPSDVCVNVLKLTGNQDLAKTLGAVAIPISIAFVVLCAIIIRYLIVFALGRAVRRTVNGQPLLHRVVSERVRQRVHDGVATTAAPTAGARRQQRAETIGSVLRSVTSVFVYGIAVIEILGIVGIDLAPIIAGAGIVGVAVAFGAQNLVSDFISGVFMVLEDQYGVGDWVDLGPAAGTVESVALRVTRVRDVNGTLWHVRNGVIQRAGNSSQGFARSVLDVTIAYDQPVDEAERLIKQAADRVWHDEELGASVLAEPEVWGVQELGTDAVTIRAVMRTAPAKQWSVERKFRGHVKALFDENGVAFPFARQRVWLQPADTNTQAGTADGNDHRAAEAVSDNARG